MEDEIIKEFFESVLDSDIEKEIMKYVLMDLPEDEIVDKMLQYYLKNKNNLKNLGEGE